MVVAGFGLVWLNQHRLQPWHYQLTLFAALFLWMSAGGRWKWLQHITISVYFYSAISKFDYEFLYSMGPRFLQPVLRVLGIGDSWDWQTLASLSILIPVGELLIAIGLAWPRSRWWAGWAAIGFHLGLTFLLSPLGLNHSFPVLLWNVHFLGIAVCLFVLRPRWGQSSSATLATANDPRDQLDAPEKSHAPRVLVPFTQRLAAFACVVLMLLPLLERAGKWDHWPSWAVYAPHNSRVDVWVASTSRDKLPATLRELTTEPELGTLWISLPLRDWSQQTLGVPLYPQDRFQLGVARAIANQLNSEIEIRATLLGPASRFDGHRNEWELSGRTAIRQASEKFWLNTMPREEFVPHEND